MEDSHIVKESLRKIYFKSGHIRILRHIVGFRVDNWVHVYMEDGSEAIINQDEVEMIHFWGESYRRGDE
jgi:hypothetical protein